MDREIVDKIDCALDLNDYYQNLDDIEAFNYRGEVILKYGRLLGRSKPQENPPFSVGCGGDS